MKFCVSILRLPNHLHSHAFDEVAESVVWGLNAIGHDALYWDNWTGAALDRRRIIFGAHLHNPRIHPPLPDDAIFYNLEQTTASWVQALYLSYKKHIVWDYSVKNVDFWGVRGVKSSYVPISYAPILTRIQRKPEEEQNIDVLFYGALNGRRMKVLNDLEATGLKLAIFNNLYGPERDDYIARAKLVLNVHFYDPAIFEIARCSYLWANRVPVISEPSVEGGCLLFYDSYPYPELVETCQKFVSSPDMRKRLAEDSFKVFSLRDIRPVLEQAISELV